MGVRRKRWRGRTRFVVCGLVVLVVVLASAGAYALTGGEPATTAKSSTARVDRGDVTTAVATTGALEPAQTRTLSFATDGTVTVVNVRAGDQVKPGQVLAEIDATDAQERVDDAQDALDEAEEALDEAQEAEEAADEGTSTCAVSAAVAGQVVPVSLVSSGGASPSPTPSSSVSVQPSPSPSASQSTKPSTSQPPRTSAPSGSSGGSAPGGGQAPGGESSACPGGGAARGGDQILSAQQRVTSAELALAEAKDQLAGTKITAPIAGKVLSVGGAVGTEVSTGSTFLTLADVAGMQVRADFPEADAGRLELGLSATVTLANRPGEEFAARVVQVNPVGTADGDMVRYSVVLAFEEVPGELLVGQSAGVRVRTGVVTGVLRVPSTAVRAEGKVVVRTAAGDETRVVEIGLRGDQYTEVKSGLIEGDEIVIAGT